MHSLHHMTVPSVILVTTILFLSTGLTVKASQVVDDDSVYNVTIISDDISRVSLRKMVSEVLENMTSFIAAFNSRSMTHDEAVQDESMNGIMGAIASGASSVVAALAPDFVCKKSEKQLVTVNQDKAKVCCNSQLDITRTCATHRCSGLSAGNSCCMSQKTSRNLCRGLSLGELARAGSGIGSVISSIIGTIGQGGVESVGATDQNGVNQVGQPLICRSGPLDVRIDIKTSQARACCVSTSPCGGLLPCNTITRRTYKRTNRIEYCCQFFLGGQTVCTGGDRKPQPVYPQPPIGPVYPIDPNPQPVYPQPPIQPVQPVYPQPPPVQPIYPPPQPVYPPNQVYPPVVQPPPRPRPCLYTRGATSGRMELLNAKIQAAAIMLRERLTDPILVTRLNDIVLSIGNRLAAGIVSMSDGPFKHYLDPR